MQEPTRVTRLSFEIPARPRDDGPRTLDAENRRTTYAPFPFLPDPAPRDYGGIFELRTYHLTAGGLPGTMDGWEAAIGPAHRYTDHLVTAMYGLDGDLRITHIWGFGSVAERFALRETHYDAGLWPPEGGPERILHAASTIAKAEPGLTIR